MWRAFFLAVGITLIIIGAECLVVEQAIVIDLKQPSPQPAAINNAYGAFNQPQQPAVRATRPLTPPDWAPWSLMGAGTVVVLYSFTIPKRVSS